MIPSNDPFFKTVIFYQFIENYKSIPFPKNPKSLNKFPANCFLLARLYLMFLSHNCQSLIRLKDIFQVSCHPPLFCLSGTIHLWLYRALWQSRGLLYPLRFGLHLLSLNLKISCLDIKIAKKYKSPFRY